MLPVVIPAAPGSPHLSTCLSSLGGAPVFLVSEEGRGGATHVPVPTSAGFSARANAGLAAARAQGHAAALLLNDDTELVGDALRVLGDGVARHRLVGGVLEHWHGGVQQAGLDVSDRTGRIRGRVADPGSGARAVDALSGAALAIDLGLWAELGGFDERYAFYFEDIDLCRRARARGVDAMLLGAARIRHRGGGTRGGRSHDAAHHLGRSHTLFVRSLPGSALARSLRMSAVVGVGAAWTVRSVGPSGLGPFVRGVLAGLAAPLSAAAAAS